MQSNVKLWFVGVVAVAAMSVSFGCGDTATSADTSFVESATAPSATLGVAASASSFGEGPAGRHRGDGPPEEALEACADVDVGGSCSFTSRRGDSLSGTCTARPDDSSQVACRPDEWPGREGQGRDRRGPPEEALTACAAAESGEACSFEAPFGAFSGSCRTSRDGDALVCFPSDFPRR